MSRVRLALGILASVLRGLGHDPRVVAAARALALAVIGAALEAAVAYFQGAGAALSAAPVALLVLRYLEGVYDNYRNRKAVSAAEVAKFRAPGAA